MKRPADTSTAEDEVVGLASDLIRIDSTNTGDPDTLVGERAAAEYVAEKLGEVGFEVTYLESGAPGRGNVIARLPGADRRGHGGAPAARPGGRGHRRADAAAADALSPGCIAVRTGGLFLT